MCFFSQLLLYLLARGERQALGSGGALVWVHLSTHFLQHNADGLWTETTTFWTVINSPHRDLLHVPDGSYRNIRESLLPHQVIVKNEALSDPPFQLCGNNDGPVCRLLLLSLQHRIRRGPRNNPHQHRTPQPLRDRTDRKDALTYPFINLNMSIPLIIQIDQNCSSLFWESSQYCCFMWLRQCAPCHWFACLFSAILCESPQLSSRKPSSTVVKIWVIWPWSWVRWSEPLSSAG